MRRVSSCQIRKASGRGPNGPLVEDVHLLFDGAGISIAPYERPFEVCIEMPSTVVGASTVGRRFAEGGEVSFSIAVDEDARRQGIARRLVESIIRQHPGETLAPWVVSDEMAHLLESMGFEWDREGIYMLFDVPTKPRCNGRRSNVSVDRWIGEEARRLSRTPRPASSTTQQTQGLFTGPLLARPTVPRLPRPPAAFESWPYGSLDSIIARVVAEAVEAHGGNVRGASRALGVSHTTTMRWLEKYRKLVEAGDL